MLERSDCMHEDLYKLSYRNVAQILVWLIARFAA